MQETLFDTPAPARKARLSGVQPQPPDEAQLRLAAALPPQVRLGGSTWSYPGWAGLVWDKRYSEQLLSKKGLSAYAQQPLLRAVSIDRGFYRALTAAQFERYAAQVPADFRFTVKAPSLVCDALVRDDEGRGMRLNEAFLDPALAVGEFIAPALEGLGGKIGALVFQLSPIPPSLPAAEVLRRLDALLQALPPLQSRAPDGVIAVELRNPELLTPEFVAVLRAAGATYCLGLHPKLPPLQAQLPLLRALWPGPLVCRWNLHRRFGAFGYEDAEKRYGEYERIVDPDPQTHEELARVIRGTAGAGQNCFVTISNHAEGCAPLTIRTLAEAIVLAG